MDLITFLTVIVTFVSWGVSSFIAKLATNRIGAKSALFDILGYAPGVVVYSLIILSLKIFYK